MMQNTDQKGSIRIIPESELQSIQRILLIQYKPFGDILLNTAYFPALRNKYPNAKIDFLIQRPYLTILEDNPYIDELVIMEKKKGIRYYGERIRTIRRIRKRHYDLIIDQLRGTGSAQITLFSGAKYRIGWHLKRWNWVYNYKIPRENIRYYGLLKFDLLKPLGIDEQKGANLFYHVKDESFQYIDEWRQSKNISDKKLVIISPGSPVARKQWSLDNFAKLCDLIQTETDYITVLLWGPGERNKVDAVKENMQTTPVIACPTTFNQAGALLKRSAMYIGNDGGINHLAIALETPSIAVFGATSNPKKWVAWHKQQHMYLRDWNFKNREDRSFNITPEQVFAKFKEYFKL